MVDIADVGDLDPCELREVFEVGFAPLQSHDPDAEFLARLGVGAGAPYERSGSGGADEVTAVLHLGMLAGSETYPTRQIYILIHI